MKERLIGRAEIDFKHKEKLAEPIVLGSGDAVEYEINLKQIVKLKVFSKSVLTKVEVRADQIFLYGYYDEDIPGSRVAVKSQKE